MRPCAIGGEEQTNIIAKPSRTSGAERTSRARVGIVQRPHPIPTRGAISCGAKSDEEVPGSCIFLHSCFRASGLLGSGVVLGLGSVWFVHCRWSSPDILSPYRQLRRRY